MRAKFISFFLILLVVGAATLMAFKVEKGKLLFGISITPELINKHRKLNVQVPEEEFNPENEWEQTWKVWLPGRAILNSGSGFIKVKQTNTDSSENKYKINPHISVRFVWQKI